MKCLEAIQYIKNVRQANILFQVKKIYLNRNEFKQDYDILCQLHSESRNKFLAKPV